MKIFTFFLTLFSLNIFSSEEGPCIYFESPSYIGSGSYGSLFSAKVEIHGGSKEERASLIDQFPFLGSNHLVAIKIKAYQEDAENRNFDSEVYHQVKAVKSGASVVPLHAAFSSETPFAFEDLFLETSKSDISQLKNTMYNRPNCPVISTRQIKEKTCINFDGHKQTLMIMPFMHTVDKRESGPKFIADMVKAAISFYRWSIYHNDLFLKNTLTDHSNFFICDFGSAKIENRSLGESANDFRPLFANDESFNQFIKQLEEIPEKNRIDEKRDFDPNIFDPNWKNLKLCQKKMDTEKENQAMQKSLKKFLTQPPTLPPVEKSIFKKK